MSVIGKSPDELLYCTMLSNATTLLLADVLNPNVPWVYLHQHNPNESGSLVYWWNATTHLNRQKDSRSLRVRGLNYDLEMSTAEFLKSIEEFAPFGVWLAQFERPVPDTLMIDRENPSLNRILLQNGMFLNFILPHKGASALLSCKNEEYMTSLLEKDSLNGIAYW